MLITCKHCQSVSVFSWAVFMPQPWSIYFVFILSIIFFIFIMNIHTITWKQTLLFISVTYKSDAYKKNVCVNIKNIFGIITLSVQFNLNICCKWSLFTRFRYYWLSSLNIAINSFPKYDDMFETTKYLSPYEINNILLEPSIFRTSV